MTTQKNEYSSITTHKELLKAISEISDEIKQVSDNLDSTITDIRYRYSFTNLIGILATKVQIFKNTFGSITKFIKRTISNEK